MMNNSLFDIITSEEFNNYINNNYEDILIDIESNLIDIYNSMIKDTIFSLEGFMINQSFRKGMITFNTFINTVKNIFLEMTKFIQSIFIYVSSKVFKIDERLYYDNIEKINKFYNSSTDLTVNDVPFFSNNIVSIYDELISDHDIIVDNIDQLVDLSEELISVITNMKRQDRITISLFLYKSKRKVSDDSAEKKLIEILDTIISKITGMKRFEIVTISNFKNIIYNKYFGSMNNIKYGVQKIKKLFPKQKDLCNLLNIETFTIFNKFKNEILRQIKDINSNLNILTNSNLSDIHYEEKISNYTNFIQTMLCLNNFPIIVWKIYYISRKAAIKSIKTIINM